MNKALIERHNERVKPGDLVYHLGDIFWRKLDINECRRIIDALNGNHYYVWGNHEEHMEKNLDLQKRFVWCKDIARVWVTDYPKIVLCHYAMRVWRGSQRGTWHLYGHSHGDLPENESLSFDVGVDCWNWYPVSLEEVAAKMQRKIKAQTNDLITAAIACRNRVVAETERMIEEHV